MLNKTTLDNDELSNYRPFFNLSVISTIIEHMLNSTSLISSLPTSYLILTSLPSVNIIPLKLLCCTFTIISSMQQDHKKYHAFVFWSLFGTIDHNILITHLSSWFGIHDSVLCWFKPYLSSRSFCVKCDNNLSSLHTSSFRYASPCLWNQLPLSLRQPHSGISSSISDSPIPSPITSSSFDSPLCLSTTPSLFHSRLKTYPFHKSYPHSFTYFSWTAFMDYLWDSFFWAIRFLFFHIFFVSVPCARLSWPSRQLLSACKSTGSYRIVPAKTRWHAKRP